jgi:fructosamine-3-kinase
VPAADLSESWQARVASALGAPRTARALGGSAWQVDCGDRRLVVKTGAGVLDEASGLRLLGSIPTACPVPEVLLAEDDLLVTSFVAQGARSPAHEEALGRGLARLHAAGWHEWGGGSSFIGMCRVDAGAADSGPAFYGRRLFDLARRCGLAAGVERVVSRLEALLPDVGPALLHGDLWWGNVLWGADGRAWPIDPSVHGGHPEEDMAMLALFGRVPSRLLGAYLEVRPLPAGWEERVDLFQLYPLLVHTVLFGGGYRGQAEAVIRRYS